VSEEQVLVIPATRLHSLGFFTGLTTDIDRYLPALLEPRHLSFRHRSKMEIDTTWLQLIPYVVLEHAGRLFYYTRGKSGGEKRLHALKSIGIGGHINPVDSTEPDPYRAGMMRELTEEVELQSPFTERILGLVHDPSTPVGQVHLGIVHVLTLERPEVSPREDAVGACGFTFRNQLIEQIDAFESWSQFALRAIV
jgi:predicted NUDIX family phosphoesterase